MTDVNRTYDRIASHFAQTREYPWPEVETFLDGRAADVALDLGCGNGRHAELLAERADCVLGVDASVGLLREASDRAHERDFAVDLIAGDAARIPLQADAVGLAVYVATLHHLPDRRARVASLDELGRVLGADGAAVVSVWSTEHDRFAERETRGASDSRAADGRETTEGFDTTVDWTLPGGETVPRFYHVYDPAEFDADLADSALSVVESFVSSGNSYAVVTPE